MIATIFDGHGFRQCSADEARQASGDAGLTWIDIRLDSLHDAEALDMATAAGVPLPSLKQALTQDLDLAFRITSAGVHGIGWLDDNDGSPAVQCAFAWNQHRLVTIRLSGDKAMSLVQTRIQDRADALMATPSKIVGSVLQLMMATVQRGLTDLSVKVGTLDMEIIDTSTPQSSQSAQLTQFRKTFQPLALRFPVYLVNVNTALIDPGSVPGLDAAGISELQQFATDAQNTASIIGNVADGIRNAAQDIQGQVSTWQGNRINALTMVTMIFLPISFLTGYFGMNFSWLDNQLNSWASWFILGFLLMIVVALGSMLLLVRHGYSLSGEVRERRRRKRAARQAAQEVVAPGSR
jgi:hypothetical protein